MFFVVQVTNNVVFAFNISMPLHMIYRSGSLIANLVLGVVILKNRYTATKYLSVFLITLGIILCTLASTGDMSSASQKDYSEAEWQATATGYIRWLTGIAILTFALFMSARMGIYQETVYKKYGKHPGEAMFYNHLLPLPGFLLLSHDIYHNVLLFNASEPIVIPVLMLSIPKMWIYLAGNVMTQFVCIKSVFVLTTECTSLTVTMVVTLRKFLSLLFSIVYFQNPFTYQHWIGTILVFGGTALFTDLHKMRIQMKSVKQE
ncbi:UDP-xylose and UDP-N-acetylglucosamine transporter-like [Liolophura sinensis]|uniref:UDP-xylose and UDP-N-acetylglucosamine transporter-like n=1 Tax=Liolophura sinensis TaxID=3198878 RepID=UPI003158160F